MNVECIGALGQKMLEELAEHMDRYGVLPSVHICKSIWCACLNVCPECT